MPCDRDAVERSVIHDNDADEYTPRYMPPEEFEAWKKSWNIGGEPVPYDNPVREAEFWREWATSWLPMFLDHAQEKGWRDQVAIVRAEIAEAWAHWRRLINSTRRYDSSRFKKGIRDIRRRKF